MPMQELHSIRFQLTRLVATCVIPLCLFSLCLVCYVYTSHLEQVEEEIVSDARGTTAVIDLELSRVQGALTTLASSDYLARGDLKGFYRRSCETALQFRDADIVLADASGQQLVNTLRPWGYPLPKRGNREAVRAIFQTGQPSIGNLFVGALTGRHLICVDIPVIQKGKVRYDLSMAFPASRFLTLLRKSDVPRNGNAAIFDRNAIFVARAMNHEGTVGKPALPELSRTMASASSGLREGRDWEGEVTVAGFCRSSLSGWTVVVSVPKSLLMGDIYPLMAWTIGFTLLISIIGLTNTIKTGREIEQSIKSLVVPAGHIGRGEPILSIEKQKIRETSQVANALLEASHLIQRHISHEREQQIALREANELLERRVQERTSALEAAVREQESFSYSVSHDLRAPLRHINCYSAILFEQERDSLSPEGRHLLDRIRSGSCHLGVLIDNLLELARINRSDLEPKQIDLSAVATATVNMFRETEPDRMVKAEIASGLSAWGDASLLKQLLQNLLGNAWKYTSQRKSARIEFGCCPEGEGTAFFIKDNGAGFNMAYSDRLFKVFERLHGSEFEGVGIGLATAQRVVQRHGGKIWACGKEGEGATFYFTLPSAPA